jgi:hypothetical protein
MSVEAEKKQGSEDREKLDHEKGKNMIYSVAVQHLYEYPNNLSHHQQKKMLKQLPLFSAKGFTVAGNKLRYVYWPLRCSVAAAVFRFFGFE